METLKPASAYKLNNEKVNELLKDGSTLTGFEKHVLQEGLKELLFGNGPINIQTMEGPGNITSFQDITPTMKRFLLDYDVILDIESEDKIDAIMDKIKGSAPKESSPEPKEAGPIFAATSEDGSSVFVSFSKGQAFLKGMQTIKFGFPEGFDILNPMHYSALHIVCDKNLYYGETLLFKAGDKIPYFVQVNAYSEHNKQKEVLLTVDLRSSNIITNARDFDQNKLNTCGHNLKAAPVEFNLTLKY